MRDYYQDARDLTHTAPAQARVLKHMLVNPDQTTPKILEALDISDGNFRRIVGSLRDKGIEVVVRRVENDPHDATKCDYLWSINQAGEVEGWASGRQGAMTTAWKRVEATMTRHIKNVDGLDPIDAGRAIGALERVSEDIARVDVFIEKRIEEARIEKERVAEEQARQLGLEVEA